MGGGRSIAWRGHLKMMAAAQPFLSGAISKTINMPEESTVEDIMQAYIESWKLGLKAVAIYRDNSKGSQPLSAAGDKKDRQESCRRGRRTPLPRFRSSRNSSSARHRGKLPSERSSITHKFSIGGHEGYITVGMYETAGPAKFSSRWPRKARRSPASWTASRFPFPSACSTACRSRRWSTNSSTRASSPPASPAIRTFPYAKSVLDYIARWLGGRFISPDYLTHNGEQTRGLGGADVVEFGDGRIDAPGGCQRQPRPTPRSSRPAHEGAPACSECGMLMAPNGACYKCENCGSTSGCS